MRRRSYCRRTVWRLAWVAALAAAAAARPVAARDWAPTEAEPAAAPPFERLIKLELWGKTLSDAVLQIGRRGEITVIVHPHFIPPGRLREYRLFLQADRVSVRGALDMLARALGCRYRITDERVAVLGAGYEWVEEDARWESHNVDALVFPPEGAAGLEGRLRELVKPAPLMPGTNAFFLRVEAQPLSEAETTHRVVGFLPETLSEYFRRALREMEGRGFDPAAVPPPGTRAAPAAGDRALAERVAVRYRDEALATVLYELSIQSGLRIGFDQEPLAGAPPPETLTLELGVVTVREALEALGGKLGFAGQVFCPPDLVWLTRDPHRWTVDRASREALWDELEVMGYNAGLFLEAWAEPDELVDRLRRLAAPEVWADPATALVLNRRTGVLAVVAPPDVQREVAQELAALIRDEAAKRP